MHAPLLQLEYEFKKAQRMDGMQLAFALIIELWKLITGNNIEPSSPKPLSPTLRQEVRKLDQTLKEYKLLCENQIDSAQELVSFIEKKSTDISALESERQKIYNRIRRPKSEEEKELNKAVAREISAKLKPLRKELKTAKAITEHYPHILELLEIERDMEAQIKIKTKERTRQHIMNEIKNIKITDLISAPDNPFKVTMDTEMERLIESIAETGVIAPIIARPTDNGKYEIVSGHRRKYACGYLGIKSVPTIIKELDHNEAVIFLVDSNLQRENILPSEKAFAYKMKFDALSAQGKRTDLTSCQVGTKLRSDELMAQSAEDSARQIQRYIRLTNLIPPILDMVDEKRIAFTPAVELSYLLPEEQTMLLSEMEYNDCTPNLSQAQRLKELSMQGLFTKEGLSAIMSEEKANQKERVKTPAERIRKYFPKDYTTVQIEETIVKLCEAYHRKRLRDRDSR